MCIFLLGVLLAAGSRHGHVGFVVSVFLLLNLFQNVHEKMFFKKQKRLIVLRLVGLTHYKGSRAVVAEALL